MLKNLPLLTIKGNMTSWEMCCLLLTLYSSFKIKNCVYSINTQDAMNYFCNIHSQHSVSRCKHLMQYLSDRTRREDWLLLVCIVYDLNTGRRWTTHGVGLYKRQMPSPPLFHSHGSQPWTHLQANSTTLYQSLFHSGPALHTATPVPLCLPHLHSLTSQLLWMHWLRFLWQIISATWNQALRKPHMENCNGATSNILTCLCFGFFESVCLFFLLPFFSTKIFILYSSWTLWSLWLACDPWSGITPLNWHKGNHSYLASCFFCL